MKIGTFLLHLEQIQQRYQIQSLAEVVANLAAQGLQCVDGDTKVYERLELPEVKKMLDAQGIQTSSVYHVAVCDGITGAGREKLMDDLKYQLDRCAFMETKILMPVPQCSADIALADRPKLMLEYFNTAIEAAKPYPITVAAENYSRAESRFTSVAEVGYYLNQLPQLGFVLDTGNFWFTGANVTEACDKYLDRIVHVHMKDIKEMTVDPIRTLEGRGFDSVAIGDGDLPLRRITERLKENGYEGTLSIEISSPLLLKEKMERSIGNLQTWTHSFSGDVSILK